MKRKNKNWSKVLALLLTVCTLFSMAGTASAASTAETNIPVIDVSQEAENVGDKLIPETEDETNKDESPTDTGDNAISSQTGEAAPGNLDEPTDEENSLDDELQELISSDWVVEEETDESGGHDQRWEASDSNPGIMPLSLAGDDGAADWSRLKPLSTMANSKQVTSTDQINGVYVFAPQITAQTKMSVGGGNWDNTYLERFYSLYPNKVEGWWPLLDTSGWINGRSKILLPEDKGKIWVKYDNVGSYLGHTVSMKVTFLDWEYDKGLQSDDYAWICVTLGESGKTSYPATPNVDVRCITWLDTRYEFFDENGNRLDIKGHFTLSDLDYYQGFRINTEYDGVYYTAESAARQMYDPSTKTVWNTDGKGTSPSNPNGWVTYIYSGSKVEFRFMNNTYYNPASDNYMGSFPDWSEVAAKVASWPDTNAGCGYPLNNWWWRGIANTPLVWTTGNEIEYGHYVEGSVKTTSSAGWEGAEFSFTAEVPFSYKPTANLIVKKSNSDTGEVISDAEFTVYERNGSEWTSLGKMTYSSTQKYFKYEGLTKNSTNDGRFKIVETKTPTGYVGSWSQEFRITEEGLTTIDYTVTNDMAKGRITVTKTDQETGSKLSGAKYQVVAKGNITSPQGKILVADGTVVATLTTGTNGTATTPDLYLGTYTVKEIAPPEGYVLTTKTQDVTLSYVNATTPTVTQNVTFQNPQTSVTILKRTPKTAVVGTTDYYDYLDGVKFKIWNKASGTEAAAKTYTTANGGKITLKKLAAGTYCYKETATLPGYVLDDTIREFTIDSNGCVDGKDEITLTVDNNYTLVDIVKVDANTGSDVAGATLAVYKEDGTLVSRFVTANYPYRLVKVVPGKYKLVEEKAPEGWALASPIEFEVKETSDVQTVTMVDLQYTDLTVAKKIKTEEITWAHGNPIFLINVTGKDLFGGQHEYNVALEFTKAYVDQNTDADGYVTLSKTIKNIPMGTAYNVTELKVNRYGLIQVEGTDNVTIEKRKEPEYGDDPSEVYHISANLQEKPTGTVVTLTNKKYRWDDNSHGVVVENKIPMK